MNREENGLLEKRKAEETLRVRGLAYVVVVIMTSIGILIAVNQLFQLRIASFMPVASGYYFYILASFLSITFLLYPGRDKDKNRIPWYDWMLFFICIVTCLFFGANAYRILTEGWEFTGPPSAIIGSFIMWILALEGVRRTTGNILFLIAGVFSFYPLYGHFLPSVLYGAPFTLTQAACQHAMGGISIIGIPVRVFSNLIIGFIIFGVALVSSGGGKFFMDFAMSILGSTRGGAAKVSVISSAFMASLSGSVISNIITTGSMTIPAMKRTGYEAKYAGAIEACASTGGVIMPPIMGAAAFLIASFMNVSYANVMLAAFFPASLYYITLLLQVDDHAAKAGIGGMPREELPDFWDTMKKGWFYILSLLLLIFLLVYIRIESWAPFYTIIFLFACAMIRKSTRYTWKKFVDFLFESAKLLGQIAGIMVGIGLIIGALSFTGVANSFSRELVILAGNNYFLLLIFGAITSFVLGIGMTVTACYVFLAIILVPALVKVGLHPMACHLFVLYWGVLSFITPPVAIGSMTAATLAGSDPWATGWLSMKLGSAKYIVPFFFVLNPALIMVGPLWIVLVAIISAIIGCIFLAASLEGWLYCYGKVSLSLRVPLFVAGLSFMLARWYSMAIGGIIICLFIVVTIYYQHPIQRGE